MKSKPIPAKPSDGVAWITGASSGIGYELALKLAGEGWKVAVSARNADALSKLAKLGEGRIFAYPLDVSDEAACAATIDQIESDHGNIALAVLNAGVYKPVEGKALDMADFKLSFDVNLYGIAHCLVPLSHKMVAQNKGQVAITSSVAGYTGLPSSAAYGATKAALINMAEALRFDFEKLGLLIQIINPGFVETPATDKNEFNMPALMSVDAAADRIVKGLATTRFEITFPRRFTYVLKLFRILPYWAYFWLVGRGTGSSK